MSFKLAEQFKLPLYHMDRLHWKPGWVESTREELIEKLNEVTAQPRWLIEGNYSGTFDQRLPLADAIYFLDFPRRIYRWRVIKRVLTGYGRTPPDKTEGCPERFDIEFIRYVWRFHREAQPRILRYLEAHPDLPVLRFDRPSQLTQHLRSLKSA
ncbi:MAG: topology modulation protein [Planctomycetota bacterium]